MSHLGEFVSKLKQFHSLDISGNNISTLGLTKLLMHLSDSSCENRLKSLNLSWNLAVATSN